MIPPRGAPGVEDEEQFEWQGGDLERTGDKLFFFLEADGG